MKFGPRTCLIFGLIAVSAVVLAMSVDTVGPRSITHGNMHMMKRRIQRYAAATGSLPTSLDQLPRIAGYVNEVTDGWGKPILWHIEGDEVTLISFGRDGVPGGSGEDEDMVGMFRAKTADGRWADELCEWRGYPFAPVK